MMASIIRIKVNGTKKRVEVEPRELLVDVIRDKLGLVGTKVGCETSNCGACTVIVDGRAVKSCTMFAVQADGKEITTVEGLSKDGELHPIQKAFVEKHGMQCGFCTSGMLMTAYWLLNNRRNPNDEEIKRHFSGNLCRCTGYQDIIESVKHASRLMYPKEEQIEVSQ
ncbi:MAG: (2Fe-2S)-binding protein [Candidatus Thermoplasmatota archaeon]|nr:(2Fe-2S)-binding protein [Candidatus Thermoplasmatota archaeon]